MAMHLSLLSLLFFVYFAMYFEVFVCCFGFTIVLCNKVLKIHPHHNFSFFLHALHFQVVVTSLNGILKRVDTTRHHWGLF